MTRRLLGPFQQPLRLVVRALQYALWSANGVFGAPIASRGSTVSVLIAYYNPARTGHLTTQVRNILKCRFVDRIVVSSHNPDLRLRRLLELDDPRVTVLDGDQRHGCGHRWVTAAALASPYVLVIDDDIRLFPRQLARLFQSLVDDPDVPHGLTGLVFTAAGSYEYCQRRDQTVDVICEAYAVTRDHLRRYQELSATLSGDPAIGALIESAADCVVLSHAGGRRPRVHNLGRVFRCITFNQVGVAVHRDATFVRSLFAVRAAIQRLLGEEARNAP